MNQLKFFVALASSVMMGILPLAGENYYEHPLQYYPAPLKTTVLHIPLPGSDGAEVIYQIVNYSENVVKTGNTVSAEGIVAITAELPEGFYRVVLNDDWDNAVGVYAAKKRTGLESADPFFSIDGCFSWMYSDYTPQKRKELVQILKNNYIAMLRERFSLRGINPTRYVYNFGPDDQKLNYTSLRNYCEEVNLPLLDVYHDTPDYMAVGERVLPGDLIAVADSFDALSREWGDSWGGFEIWNEPDLLSIPDLYGPYLKAMIFAAQNLDTDVKMAGIVSCEGYPTEFHEYCAKNGILNQIDVLSYHSYGSAFMMEENVRLFRAFLKRYGQENLPLWITETNRSYNGTARGEAKQREYRLSALNLAATAMECKAAGVERIFPFIFAEYNEGPFAFGMIGKYESPNQLAAAYFTAAQLLRHKNYAGDLLLDVSGLQKARVFAADDGTAVAVFAMADPDVRYSFTFPWKGEIRGIDNRLIASGEGDQVEFSGGMAYLLTELENLEPGLNIDTATMDLFLLSRVPHAGRPNGTSVIIQPLVDMSTVFNRTNTSYVYDLEEMDNTISIPVQLSNLGTEENCIEMTWNIMSPDGTELQAAQTPITLHVPARSNAATTLSLPLKQLLQEHLSCDLTIRAVGDECEDTAVVNFKARQFDKYETGPVGVPGKRIAFSNQKNWLNMGALWQWETDLDCSFTVAWTPTLLTIELTAIDDTHFQQQFAQKLWMNDSMQLALSPLDVEGKPVPDETLELSIALNGANESEFYANRTLSTVSADVVSRHVAATVTREDQKTVYNVTVAPQALGLGRFEQNQVIGMSLLVNDDDSFGRKGAMIWGAGIANFNGNTRTYNRLYLQ